jgi:hypothetical protein
MSRSHRDNQRRLDHKVQRVLMHRFDERCRLKPGLPPRPRRKIVRYGAPLRKYWAAIKVKRRRIERKKFKERLNAETLVP